MLFTVSIHGWPLFWVLNNVVLLNPCSSYQVFHALWSHRTDKTFGRFGLEHAYEDIFPLHLIFRKATFKGVPSSVSLSQIFYKATKPQKLKYMHVIFIGSPQDERCSLQLRYHCSRPAWKIMYIGLLFWCRDL